MSNEVNENIVEPQTRKPERAASAHLGVHRGVEVQRQQATF